MYYESEWIPSDVENGMIESTKCVRVRGEEGIFIAAPPIQLPETQLAMSSVIFIVYPTYLI